MVAPVLSKHQSAIAELCRRYHVKRLDVFGSVTREDFDPERSDIDFLVVDADWAANESAWAFLEFRDELRRLLGKPVDLIAEGGIRNRYARDEINASRERLVDQT
ncbi:MAG: nucleotidyltransferase family protein [Phycisphaeraceae bacterium]